MRIDDDVMQVLERSVTAGNGLKLPDQLDRKLYERVAKVLEAMGGKWNRAEKATLFMGDAQTIIDRLLDTGEYHRAKQDLGQFDTPPAVVQMILDRAGDLTGKFILEPSAGIGNIAGPVDDGGGIVWCFEMDPKRCEALFDRLGREDVGGITCTDFLSVDPTQDTAFDMVLMNPPFAKQADIQHVLHASEFLKPGGRLVAVMSASVTFRQNRQTVAFRDWVQDHGGTIEMLSDGAFAESGTMVRACIVTVTL